MAPDTPVAMIERARPLGQRVCASTLATMASDAQAFRLRSPAVLVIGEVAACRMFGVLDGAARHALRRNDRIGLISAKTPRAHPA